MLKNSLLASLLVAQIVVGPGSAGSGGSSTTIINNNYSNVTNTTGTFISEGCQVAYVTGYQYNVSACNYFINNSNYQSTEQSITLDAAHATLDRIDLIAVNTSGTVVKVTGTAAADPSEPTVDWETQIPLAFILVTANTTAPPGATDTVLYFDNAGGPTEWNWSTNGSCFNVNSTTNPKAPATHDIEGTTCAANAYAQGQIPASTITPSSFQFLVMFIRSKAGWGSGRGLQVQFYSAGVTVGQPVVINSSGTWGFNSSITSGYQQVAIPITNFLIPPSQTATQFRITKFGSGANIGMYIADITLQSAIGSTVIAPTIPDSCVDGQLLFNTNHAINCGTGLSWDTTNTRLTIVGQYNATPVAHGTSGAAETLDFNQGNTHTLTLDENITLTFSNPVDGGRYIVVMRQDGSGTNTVTWPATVEWPDGDVAPTFSTTANAVNLCTFYYVAAVTNYYGACNVNYVE